MIEGILAIPIKFPFTQFNRGILARKKMILMLMDLNENVYALENKKDLASEFLNIRDDSSKMMSEEESLDQHKHCVDRRICYDLFILNFPSWYQVLANMYKLSTYKHLLNELALCWNPYCKAADGADMEDPELTLLAKGLRSRL
ncbi:hypothetical protein Tco_0387224 [Tanacetum coccineum]